MAGTSYKGVALVTGADGGMGRIHTRELAKAGYEVVMACIDTGAARSVAEEIERETGGKLPFYPLDLRTVVRFRE